MSVLFECLFSCTPCPDQQDSHGCGILIQCHGDILLTEFLFGQNCICQGQSSAEGRVNGTLTSFLVNLTVSYWNVCNARQR